MPLYNKNEEGSNFFNGPQLVSMTVNLNVGKKKFKITSIGDCTYHVILYESIIYGLNLNCKCVKYYIFRFYFLLYAGSFQWNV